MKNLIILITCSLAILSCKVKTVEKTTTNTLAVQEDRPAADSALFDIKKYNERSIKKNENDFRIEENGKTIRQYSYDPERDSPDSLREYHEEIYKNGSAFVIRRGYDYLGRLRGWMLSLCSEGVGKSYWYDQDGRIIKVKDYEESFKHSFAYIREFLLEKKKIDIYDSRQAISRRVNHRIEISSEAYYRIDIIKIDYVGPRILFISDDTLEIKEIEW